MVRYGIVDYARWNMYSNTYWRWWYFDGYCSETKRIPTDTDAMKIAVQLPPYSLFYSLFFIIHSRFVDLLPTFRNQKLSLPFCRTAFDWDQDEGLYACKRFQSVIDVPAVRHTTDKHIWLTLLSPLACIHTFQNQRRWSVSRTSECSHIQWTESKSRYCRGTLCIALDICRSIVWDSFPPHWIYP